MEIVIIIIAIAGCCITYFIGKNSVEKENKLNNEKFFKEREYLEKEIKYKQETIKQIESEYQSKLKLITDAKSNAEEVYQIKAQQLQTKYEEKETDLILQFGEKKIALMKECDFLQQQLDSLKQTHAASVAAAQQEERIKADKDAYRLALSDQEIKDISILDNIKTQISKPRILCMLIWQTYYQPKAKEKFPVILGKKDVCGIYKITNLKDQRCYIGQAKDIRERYLQHCKFALGIDTPAGNKLYQAMMKDKLENFSFQLLEECLPDELNQKEAYYIDLYNSCEFGYNSNTGNRGVN